jgi:hypothetical protein
MTDETATRERDAAQVASHKRGWMIFFGLLLLMTVAGISLEIWFNEQQRLRPPQLDHARELWETNRPAEYQFSYKIVDQEKDPVSYTVRVRRNGSFRLDSSKDTGEEKLVAGDVPYLSMEDLFEKIDAQLADDNQPGKPRVFAKGDFDRRDGHVLRYIRSVRASHERIEVNVTDLQPIE